MKHYGDITKLQGFVLPTTDVVTGGSPCQDLSVAGKRAGLEGKRSGLYMEQIRVIKEMRENDQFINGTEGADIRPRYMVWENVPGAFSSNKGEDFRAVLEEAAKVCDETAVIPAPPKGKWHNSGVLLGDGWSIAWRVFDAQFWGVPQRRRRIYLVADFGGHTAGEILFKRDSLPGYLAASGEPGQGIATHPEGCADAAGGPDGGGSGRGRSGELVGVDCYNQTTTGDVAKSLNSAASDSDHVPCVMSIEMGALERDQGNRMWEEVAPTMRASVNDNSPCHVLEPFVKSRHAKFPGDFETWVEGEVNPTLNNFDVGDVRTTTAVVQKEVFEWHNQDSRVTGPIDTACTINTNAGGREGHLVMDAPAYCLQGSMIGREEKNGPQGDGVNEEVSFTLNTIDRHAVSNPPITLQIRSGKEGGGKGPLTQEDLSATLTAGNTQYLFENHSQDTRYTGLLDIAQTVSATYGMGGNNQPFVVSQFGKPKAFGISSYASNAMLSSNPHSGCYEAETSRTLDLNGGNPACNQGGIMIMDDRHTESLDCRNFTINEELSATIQSKPSGGQSLNYINPIHSLETYHCENHEETASTLKARDWKDPQCVNQQSVRRLTPLECERLQGFPDNWTDIPDYIDENGKKKTASDSARYKALGNSVALPNVYYVLYGIAEQLGFQGTVGSLFDGIGGFPICWETLCGKGTALWASEIEDFPIAVTKYRFGGG